LIRASSSKASRLGAILLGVLLLLSFVTPSHANELGLRVQIDVASDPSNRSSSYELWFTGEKAQDITRRITVTSLSEIPQRIDFLMYDPIVVNGESTMDFTKLGRYQDWLSVSPDNRIINPGERLEFELTIAVPEGTDDLGAKGILRVLANQALETEVKNSTGGFQAVVQGGAAIDLGFQLGVGEALTLLPQFTIESVEGVLLEGGNYLRIFFRNEGALPILLAGSLQLKDAVFDDRVFGPYEYRTPEIPAGQFGYLDIPAEEGIVEGDYTAYVVAQQLGVRETRLFDVFIEYLPPGTLKFWDIAPWGIAFVLFAVIMVLGIRILRSAGDQGAGAREAREPRQPRTPRMPRQQRVPREPRELRETRLESEPRSPKPAKTNKVRREKKLSEPVVQLSSIEKLVQSRDELEPYWYRNQSGADSGSSWVALSRSGEGESGSVTATKSKKSVKTKNHTSTNKS
jgi:hypothetical protein